MSDRDNRGERRSFLKRALLAVPGGLLLDGKVGWPASRAAAAHRSSDHNYRPSFFTPVEWAFLNAATNRLIPSNEDGPGALDLHVPEFIDRQMETEYGYGGRWYLQGPFNPGADFTLGYQHRYPPRDLYRIAIVEVNSACRQSHAEDFAELDAATQDAVLAALENDDMALPSVKAVEFFIQLLANTREGYFADPLYGGNHDMGSWKMIGFPGARADFADWVQQPGKVYPLGPVSIRGEKG
jgi:gluconate 2-dehydrogenase gamma chain